MSVKLGIAPIAWSNDDMPELGGDTSLETCLSEAREAGFTGIESGGKFPKTSKELLPILNRGDRITRSFTSREPGIKPSETPPLQIPVTDVTPTTFIADPSVAVSYTHLTLPTNDRV